MPVIVFMELENIVPALGEIGLQEQIAMFDDRAPEGGFRSIEGCLQVQLPFEQAGQETALPPGFLPLQVSLDDRVRPLQDRHFIPVAGMLKWIFSPTCTASGI
jgi:hypothetical protein